MNEESILTPGAIGAGFAERTLPRWRDLPDLELYMDQVLALIERYLGSYPGFDGKGLTASMVNNYVKLGVMPPPARKKYTRTHLAHLLMICILKTSLPIAAIQRLTAAETEQTPLETVYDRFCELFERTMSAVAEAVRLLGENAGEAGSLSPVYYAALRAQAEQALALRLYAARFPDSEG